MTVKENKMHQILALEKGYNAKRANALNGIKDKFSRPENFIGFSKILKMIDSTPENEALEKENRQVKEVKESVVSLISETLKVWKEAEEIQFQKNIGTSISKANIIFDNGTIIENVPINEIMGLESRLTELATIFEMIPVLDSSKNWEEDKNRGKGFYKEKEPTVSTKTKMVIDAKVLYAATDKHPAQVKEYTENVVVGAIYKNDYHGGLTVVQKNNLLKGIDGMLLSLKKARSQCNETQVPVTNLTGTITHMIENFIQ